MLGARRPRKAGQMIAKPEDIQSSAYDLRRANGSILHGITPSQVREMALSNDLYDDDMISRSGQDRWRSVTKLSGLSIRARPVMSEPTIEPIPEVFPISHPNLEHETRRAEQLQTACDRLLIERDELLGDMDALRRECEGATRSIDGLQARCEQLETEARQIPQLRLNIGDLQKQSDALGQDLLQAETALETQTNARTRAQNLAEDLREQLEAVGLRARQADTAHECEVNLVREQAATIESELRKRPEQSEVDALENAMRERDIAQLQSAEALAHTRQQYRQELESAQQIARNARVTHDVEASLLRSQVKNLTEEIRERPDPSIVQDLEAATLERDRAQESAQIAGAERDELVTTLGQSQDALRAGDDLRRALEKSLNSMKINVAELSDELARVRTAESELQSAYSLVLARADSAEASATQERLAQEELKSLSARSQAERDSIAKLREVAVSQRDAALSERDSTRLAVGATQTELLKVRREFDALKSDFDSSCIALSEQTARASALEGSVAAMRSQSEALATDLDSRIDEIAQLNSRAESTAKQTREDARRHDEFLQRIGVLESTAMDVEHERDSARADATTLQVELASTRESATVESQKHAATLRELAEERSRVVARDELIFRESLRCEERETESRRRSADLAALRADCETERRRADDATMQIATSQRDLFESRNVATAQAVQLQDSQLQLEALAALEQSARSSLVAASRERDELSSALATAHAAIASREQQVSAERGLRDQAEGSSRQLLASYEKLADDTGRRITDLEIKLSDSNHTIQAARAREEELVGSLSEAHSQMKSISHKLASVEEQRSAMTRDRDSHAKRASNEAAARAVAEEKISATNERALKAERDARSTYERAVQVASVALCGAKQRLEEDYSKSQTELHALEHIVAEASKQVIATGGTLPGVPLLPREAAAQAEEIARSIAEAKRFADAKALADEKAAVDAAAAATSAALAARVESQRNATPPTSYRMIDGGLDDTTISRPQSPRAGVTNSQSRSGGQRERVSQPRAQSSSSASDDDSSSTNDNSCALLETKKAAPQVDPTRPPVSARRAGAGPVLDDAWIDDHCASDAREVPSSAFRLVTLTALAVTFTATISALPDFALLDFRAAFTRIASWVVAIPALIALVHLIARRCEPVLSRRIPILAAGMISIAPLSTMAFGSSPWIGVMIVVAGASLPWLMCYAAWPDPSQVGLVRREDLVVGTFDRRATVASIVCAALAIVGVATTFLPWDATMKVAIATPTGGCFAVLLVSLVSVLLTPSIRSHASIAAWGALAVIVAFLADTFRSQGISQALSTIEPSVWIALLVAWSSVAASSLASACDARRISEALQAIADDDAPALVAHERIHAACIMGLTAVLPLLPALVAFHLVRERSRRAESQLRSLANLEIWFVLALIAGGGAGIVFPSVIGASIVIGLLAGHAAICIAAAITVGADRFVRFPSPAALLARPGGGLDLPVPLVTIQRTAKHSPHRPIVHPCGTTIWGLATIVLGCLAVASATKSPALSLALGPILGLAIWTPSLIASRCRHQDTIVLCALATLLPVIFAIAGYALDVTAKPEGIPMLVAIGGAASGIWALLVGWAFKGMNQLSSLTQSASFEVDEFGETIAPTERPIACRRRENLMRRVAIGSSGFTAASALVLALPSAGSIAPSPSLVCGTVALTLATSVWMMAILGDRTRVVRSAGLFTAMLLASSFFAVLPMFFRATEIGALGAVGALPFCAVASIAALLTAGILNTMRSPSRSGRSRTPVKLAASVKRSDSAPKRKHVAI